MKEVGRKTNLEVEVAEVDEQEEDGRAVGDKQQPTLGVVVGERRGFVFLDNIRSRR